MYREIVTRAVVGKGRITNNSEAIIKLSNNPSKVLGCWIINHYYVSSYENGELVCRGKYDLHIWYGFDTDRDTAVHKQTIDYVETFEVKMKSNEQLSEENELITRCIKYPTCTSLNLNDDGSVSVKIDKDISLDVIGETKLKVQVTGSEDEWVDNESIDSIDVDYLNK